MRWKNILLIVLCLFLMSCDNNNRPDYSGNESFVNGEIQANIDGRPIKVPTYLVRKIINGVGTELISIHGFNCAYCIAFSFESIIGVQYIENRSLFIEMHRKLSDCDDHTHSYGEQVKAYSLIDGEINLIENSDKRVKGTFSYTAKNRMGNTVNVTDGKFDIATGN